MRPPTYDDPVRILVTGGVRSGKSTHAEALLGDAADVVYVAPGRPAAGSDPDWDARVALHRARRPPTWLTVETADVATALSEARSPVLVDCLGTWLTAIMDGEALWSAATADVYAVLEARLDGLCAALTGLPHCDRGDERGRPRGGAIPFFGRAVSRSTGHNQPTRGSRLR
ncbi:cobalamin biosynthesis protein CobU [Mycobacterium tuberculosis]|nr:cobalamin biosynthesis protein CobU [Mycobacterium tuberculosis]SGA53996.1 cobalamin biosynthesis protein CobU [Mycobacterium tuberculosis]SGC44819.1 cobalamin biosynthesis protein CobU [Mycobacterium tuberculosis]SGC50388.1 cobalamin biosynthesis protein CobU [Mycobacterium tuberculosis]SGJ38518.1 cobalamin biosynthesis protein CobU [Mycobacterium tuberculosis]